jgi:two-component sensor histidine kinase
MLLHKIGNLGVSGQKNEDKNKKTRIINYTSLFSVIAFNIHFIFNIIYGTYLVGFADFLGSQVFVLILFLNYKRKYNLVRFLLFIVFPLGLIPFNFVLGEVGSENFLFSMIILAFYILDKAIYRYFISIIYALIYLFIRLILNLDFSLELYPEIQAYFYWYNIIISFLALALISMVYTRENKNHLLLLKTQNNNLNQQNLYINKLLKELNHRVKNNLQIVSGLFNLQRYNTDNEQVNNALTDARNRILTIALLHKKLYQENTNSTQVAVKDYISDLCVFLLQSSGIEDDTDLELIVDKVKISIEDCVHLGLIINEAITNSIKYGFKHKKAKKIKVEYYQKEEFADIRISDNGVGFSENFIPDANKQFGIFLMKTLAENNEGEIKFYNKNGAVVDIKLSVVFF